MTTTDRPIPSRQTSGDPGHQLAVAAVPHVVDLERRAEGATLTTTEYGYTPSPVLGMSHKGQEQCLDKLAAAITGATR